MQDSSSATLRHPVPYIYAGLFLLTTVVFWEIQYFPFIRLDDPFYIGADDRVMAGITFQGVIRAFTEPYFVNWHPLTTISYMLDTTLYGVDPGGYHTTSLVLHVINTLLLFGVLNKLTGASWSSGFVAAIFALHPYHVEPVAWISSRKDVLSAFFIILTIAMYARYVKRKTSLRYLWVCFIFAAALLSKSMAITLPFVLLLLDYWPLGRFSNYETGTFKKLVVEKIPLFVMSAASGVITYLVAQSFAGVGTIEKHPVLPRLLNAPIAYVLYVAKAFWPVDLIPGGYPKPDVPSYWMAGAAALVLLAVTAGVLLLRKRSPYLLVGWFWFLGMLVPVIGLVSIGDALRTDRYTYVPLIGLSFLVAWGVPQLLKGRRYGKSILVSLAMIAIVGCAARSWSQVSVWEDGKNVFAEILRMDPYNDKALEWMGLEFEEEGNYEEAARYYYQAVKVEPSNYFTMSHLAISLREMGSLNKAENAFLQLTQAQPDFAPAFLGLGITQSRMGKLEEAERSLEEAIRLQPNYADAKRELEAIRHRRRTRLDAR